MARKNMFKFLAIALSLGVLTACALLSPETSSAAKHPEELGAGRPICTTCHGDETSKGALKPYSSFNHTPDFVKDHRFQATQDSGTCASCHSQPFCGECHGGKVSMKPATKLGDRPDREAQHRGDYLTLHRFDGKMDPSSCYKCHGRANNDTCRSCHR